MGRQIAQPRIIKAIVEGVEEAQRFYESCSGDCWLWEGPEYLLCASIARRIHQLEGAKYVTLESNVYQTLKDAQAVSLGAPKKKLRQGGRFDVVVWWGDGSPRVAIEVKNQVWSYAHIHKDVERIENVLQRNKENASFQFGIIAFYTSCVDNSRTKARKILERRTETLLDRTSEHVSDSISVEMVRGKIRVVDDSAWVATCLVLRL
jgi:hypothetical protein